MVVYVPSVYVAVYLYAHGRVFLGNLWRFQGLYLSLVRKGLGFLSNVSTSGRAFVYHGVFQSRFRAGQGSARLLLERFPSQALVKVIRFYATSFSRALARFIYLVRCTVLLRLSQSGRCLYQYCLE